MFSFLIFYLLVDVMVKQYDVIKWGENNELEVRETPGHTNGFYFYISFRYI